jgi:hypothetical protein
MDTGLCAVGAWLTVDVVPVFVPLVCACSPAWQSVRHTAVWRDKQAPVQGGLCGGGDRYIIREAVCLLE